MRQAGKSSESRRGGWRRTRGASGCGYVRRHSLARAAGGGELGQRGDLLGQLVPPAGQVGGLAAPAGDLAAGAGDRRLVVDVAGDGAGIVAGAERVVDVDAALLVDP